MKFRRAGRRLGRPTRADTKLDQALTGGQAQTVGRFRFFIDDERWEWSDEVQQIHGYAPGEMPSPATSQVLAHKHPDDYGHVIGALDDTRHTRAPFSTRHRMVDRQGKVHRVVVVGDVMRDADGTVVGTHGFYIDVTPAQADYEDLITEGVADATDKRAVIEQAKGMLAVVYGLEEDAAFEILKWISQHSNAKLRNVAESLVSEFRALSAPVLPERNVYDLALLALTQRMA
ncbi:PAS and ANTAR domain-containing protein [Mycobacteroides salmoniphilum]|uniref:PAS and ANTAR domain-containing protein n=1 Tax=Mycobacteroides salmoniphilum TaxID=404941 RepID=UPI0030B8D71A